MPYSVTSSSETVVLAEAKAHLNVLDDNDDTYIASLVTVARTAAEAYTKLDLVPKTIVWYMNDFPAGEIVLKDHTPLREVTTIHYLDADGTTAAVSTEDFNYDTYAEPPRIYEGYDDTWPTVYPYTDAENNVTITYASGYTTTTLPAQAKQAILIMVADLYEHRESVAPGHLTRPVNIPTAAERLLAQIAAPVV